MRHWFGEKDATGARACMRETCTIRVARAFSLRQGKKGGGWNKTHLNLIPPCAGGPLPMKEKA